LFICAACLHVLALLTIKSFKLQFPFFVPKCVVPLFVDDGIASNTETAGATQNDDWLHENDSYTPMQIDWLH
jgi:hypothetical protein